VYAKIEAIKNIHRANKLRPVFKRIESKQFDNITETNMTIYNPVQDRKAFPEVFTELPIAIEPSERYWARVDKHFSNKIIGRIAMIADQISPDGHDRD
jgi:hypothetical protein